MGLGKTIQVLSLLLAIKAGATSKPHLLVVPASLLGNWQKEAERFAPTLKIHLAHSSGKGTDFSKADIVLTTYGFIHRWQQLKETEWDLVILDEAKRLKPLFKIDSIRQIPQKPGSPCHHRNPRRKSPGRPMVYF